MGPVRKYSTRNNLQQFLPQKKACTCNSAWYFEPPFNSWEKKKKKTLLWLFFQNLKHGRRGSFFRVRNTNFVQVDKMVCSHPVVLYLQGWLFFPLLVQEWIRGWAASSWGQEHWCCRFDRCSGPMESLLRATNAFWYPKRWQGLPLMSHCRGCPPSPSLTCGSWKLEFRPGPPACMPCVCPILCVQHPLPSCLKLSSSWVFLPGLSQLETQPRAGSFLDFKHDVFSKIVQLRCLLLTQNLGCCFVSPWAAATWLFF